MESPGLAWLSDSAEHIDEMILHPATGVQVLSNPRCTEVVFARTPILAIAVQSSMPHEFRTLYTVQHHAKLQLTVSRYAAFH